MAIGSKLKDICEARELNINSWYKITTCELFKEEVKNLAEKIDAEIIEQAAEDPIRRKLELASRTAVEVLEQEMVNHDRDYDGASSATRLKAADSILNRAGYGSDKEEKSNVVVLNLNAEHLKSVMAIETPESMPDNFTIKDLKVS